MITDERIEFLATNEPLYPEENDPELKVLAQEIISLRSQKTRLIEVGKGLASGYRIFKDVRLENGRLVNTGGETALDKWNALLKELE